MMSSHPKMYMEKEKETHSIASVATHFVCITTLSSFIIFTICLIYYEDNSRNSKSWTTFLLKWMHYKIFLLPWFRYTWILTHSSLSRESWHLESSLVTIQNTLKKSYACVCIRTKIISMLLLFDLLDFDKFQQYWANTFPRSCKYVWLLNNWIRKFISELSNSLNINYF